jgi:hypothetical protein
LPYSKAKNISISCEAKQHEIPNAFEAVVYPGWTKPLGYRRMETLARPMDVS